jgi:hypothetical protein
MSIPSRRMRRMTWRMTWRIPTTWPTPSTPERQRARATPRYRSGRSADSSS